jgi:hypothetical protein
VGMVKAVRCLSCNGPINNIGQAFTSGRCWCDSFLDFNPVIIDVMSECAGWLPAQGVLLQSGCGGCIHPGYCLMLVLVFSAHQKFIICNAKLEKLPTMFMLLPVHLCFSLYL